MTRSDSVASSEQNDDAESRARAARRIEEAALSQSVGLNGYTTTAEAQTLCAHLDLAPAATLLDVGAGRGWPGSHVARTSGCRLVSTDVPWDVLLAAKTRRGTEVVAAQGGALPFRGDTFDAIVHADVFCWLPDKLSVLRECGRVLEPGGRIAGYVIHPPAGLTPSQERRAAELGPSDVTAPASPAAITESAGLTIVVIEDVTDAFRATCVALRAARRDLDAELRGDEGDEFYEEALRTKDAMLCGIDEGVLCRSLIVAKK